MCGIAGMIYYDGRSVDQRDVAGMLSTIHHRGPNDNGIFSKDCLVLGQKRLSILDLSPDGRQPMGYLDRYQLVFNGEIYNYLELRDTLIAEGYIFHTKTDTEVILAAYDFWGEQCLDHFNGMWAFILYDSKEQSVFCARDRFGVKPLYYYETESYMAIASEIKEFTVLSDWSPVGNLPRIADFILNNGAHDYSNETLFSGVYQIRPGEKMCIDLREQSYQIQTWYDLRDKKKKINISFEEAARRFEELFEDSVRLRLRSDVKVGSCLSGGLDSSAIVCIMHELLKKDAKSGIQQAIFAKNHNKGYDESEYVNSVVDKTGIILHAVTPSFDSTVANLDKIVWHQDEPFGSTSIAAQWDVYEKAHEVGLTVMLDGQGADEYLAGYSSFQRVYFRELFLKLRWVKLYKSFRQYRNFYKTYYYSPYKDLAETLIGKIIPRSVIAKLKVRIKHILGKSDRTDFILNYSKISNSEFFNGGKVSSCITEETIAQMMHTSLPKLVHHQDRNAMAHSIESRAPFLDYRLVEFVFNLPGDYKVNLGVTKYVMREGLKSILPSCIQERMDKLGFATPEDIWIRENRSQFKSLLEESCDLLSAIVDKDVLLKEFDRQVNGTNSLDGVFWCVICTAAWTKKFNVILGERDYN